MLQLGRSSDAAEDAWRALPTQGRLMALQLGRSSDAAEDSKPARSPSARGALQLGRSSDAAEDGND